MLPVGNVLRQQCELIHNRALLSVDTQRQPTIFSDLLKLWSANSCRYCLCISYLILSLCIYLYVLRDFCIMTRFYF